MKTEVQSSWGGQMLCILSVVMLVGLISILAPAPARAATSADCTTYLSSPTRSGSIVTATGSASCTALTVTVKVCVGYLVNNATLYEGCAVDSAGPGETASATASVACLLSGSYRSSLEITGVSSSGDLQFSGTIVSSGASISCR